MGLERHRPVPLRVWADQAALADPALRGLLADFTRLHGGALLQGQDAGAGQPLSALVLGPDGSRREAPHDAARLRLAALRPLAASLTTMSVIAVDGGPAEDHADGYLAEALGAMGAWVLDLGPVRAWALRGPFGALGDFDASAERERGCRESLEGSRHLLGLAGGEAIWTLRFDRGGRIAERSAPPWATHWWVRMEGSAPRLLLAGGGSVQIRLSPAGREEWSGTHVAPGGPRLRLVRLPPPTAASEAAEGRLRAAPAHRLSRGGEHARAVRLGEGGLVSWGRTPDLCAWWCEEDRDGPALLLAGADGSPSRFQFAAPGTWRGALPGAPGQRSTLGPAPEIAAEHLDLQAELARTERFVWRRPGHETRRVLLEQGGHLREPGGGALGSWWVEGAEDGPRLQLWTGGSLHASLGRRADASWRGHLREGGTLDLHPAPQGSGAYLWPEFTWRLDASAIRTIVEVGAGDGRDTLELRDHHRAQVWAFECNPGTLPLARARLQGARDVTLVELAAWDRDGTIPFYQEQGGNPSASSCYRANQGFPYQPLVQQELRVEATRLDAWCDRAGVPPIDLVCMDVQGATLAALRGLGRRLREARALILKLGQRPIYQSEPLAGEVVAFLEGEGFDCVDLYDCWGFRPDGALREQARPFFTHHAKAPPAWFGDYLFLRRGPEARRLARGVVETRRYVYTRIGHDARALELLPYGAIGEGRGACEEGWHLWEDEQGRPYLDLFGRGIRTARLHPAERGGWSGAWLIHEKMPVALKPARPGPGGPGLS
jgi:FkbM family methyltransferase